MLFQVAAKPLFLMLMVGSAALSIGALARGIMPGPTR